MERIDKGLVLGLRCSLAIDDVLGQARCALNGGVLFTHSHYILTSSS